MSCFANGCAFLLLNCAKEMAVRVHHKAEPSYSLGYSATVMIRSPSLLESSTPLIQCSSRCTNDGPYRELHAEGIRTIRKQSEFSFWRKSTLVDAHTIGTDPPQAFLFAMFYYNGLNFVPCGGKEHLLKITQLNFRTIPYPDVARKGIKCVEYSEQG